MTDWRIKRKLSQEAKLKAVRLCPIHAARMYVRKVVDSIRYYYCSIPGCDHTYKEARVQKPLD